jgi:cytochrome c oxidase subunit 3
MQYKGESLPGASTMAMALLLATLGVLFVASVAFYLLMRVRLANWPPPGAPGLPWQLWLSTLLLIVSSMTMHYALHSVRSGRGAGLKLGLGVTFLLALMFLACQVIAWTPLLAYQAQAQANLYKLAFIMLAGLHGLHVIGGLIPMGVISVAAARGAYSVEAHLPVKHIAMYWHFLDIVWLVIFVVLQVTQ